MEAPLIHPGFEAVADILASSTEGENPHGAQLCVYAHGRPVVDLAMGGVTQSSLTGVFSVSKGLGSLVIAKLVQDGVLDVTAPVVSVWPAFAANGKGAVTIEQLLSHQAGLLGRVGGLPMQDFLDSAPAAAALAQLAPLWNPGQAFGYHALSLGVFVEELVRRVTGRSAQELYEEFFRAPINAQAWLGLPQEQEHRYIPVPSLQGEDFVDPFGVAGLSMNSTAGFLDADGNVSYDLMQVPNLLAVRQAGPVSVGGVASARGLATVYAAATTGIAGEHGHNAPILSDETTANAARYRVFGVDCINAGIKGFGVEFRRPNPTNDLGSARSFGQDGANGTVAFADPSWGVAFAYVPFSPQPGGNGTTAQRLTVAVRQAIMAGALG